MVKEEYKMRKRDELEKKDRGLMKNKKENKVKVREE